MDHQRSGTVTNRETAPAGLAQQTAWPLDKTVAAKVGRRTRRCWITALSRADADAPRPSTFDILSLLDEPHPYAAIQGADQEELESGIAAFFAPYLRRAAAGLARAASEAERNGAIGSEAAAAQVLASFRERLQSASHTTAALLMNAARLRGELRGDTPEERCRHFGFMLLERSYRLEARRRFPIVDEILLTMTEDAIDAWSEFFTRLSADWRDVDLILPGGLGRIEKLGFYAGDPHNNGRSVVLVEGLRGAVVYKPRALDTDAVLGRVLGWLSDRLPFRIEHISTLAKSDYGWTEFIPARDCANQEEVELCFRRLGALLAVIHALGGGDIHHENVICRGPEPFIVDAESLLNGPLGAPTLGQRRRQRARLETVTNTCYLPCQLPSGDGFIDISGAGYKAGQQVKMNRIRVELRDDLSAEPIDVRFPPSANLPSLDGQPQTAVENLEPLVEGFRLTLQAVMRHQSELLTRPDLMPSFAAAKSRFIPRATAQYAQVLRNAMHPHLCVSRERHNHALSVLALQQGWNERVATAILAADLAALRRGDIPFYSGAANSRSIWTSSGKEIPRVLQETGHASAARRIRALDAAAIESQIAKIRLAFSASRFRLGATTPRKGIRSEPHDQADLRLATAASIADRLMQEAIIARGHVYWVGCEQHGQRLVADLTSSSLYGGIAGIGIFFAELAHKSQDQRHREFASMCLDTLRASELMEGGPIGAFEGVAGSIYADLLMSRRLGRDYSPKLARLLRHLQTHVPDDLAFDIIGGAAGALLVALRARSIPGLSEQAAETARACARHLLAEAIEMETGVAWSSPIFPAPLTGLAHGTCGIALALGEHAVDLADETAWEVAMLALDYTRSTFDREKRLWRDLRPAGGYPVAWCHGVAGMVLARQRLAERAPKRVCELLRRDIAQGLEALTREPGPAPDTICHGRSGNWEPLWKGEETHRDVAEREVSKLCADLRAGVPATGDISEPMPDLMNGLAGIGHQLLRSLDPKVPCVAILGM